MIRFPDFNGLALAGSCNVALVYWLDQIEDSMVGRAERCSLTYSECARGAALAASVAPPKRRYGGTSGPSRSVGHQSIPREKFSRSLQIGQGVASSLQLRNGALACQQRPPGGPCPNCCTTNRLALAISIVLYRRQAGRKAFRPSVQNSTTAERVFDDGSSAPRTP